MTSRILSGLMLMTSMRGAHGLNSVRGAASASAHLAEDVQPADASLLERALHQVPAEAA